MSIVSIITPLYNKSNYIIETIQSVLSQNYKNWEFLVVDNGSTDGSWEKVKQFSDSRIHILQSPKHGPGAARNYGLTHAQGEWIQFLDADDLLEPDHLEQQLAVAQQNPDAQIIACYWQEFIDGYPTQKQVKQPSGIGRSIQVLRDSSIAFAPWAVHAALVKRSALSPDYYWPEQLDQYLGEDIAFWFKLVNHCTVAYGKSAGALYRTQTPECRTQNLDVEKWFEGVHAAIELNCQWWQNRNHSYREGQCENLIRVYSQIYSLARKQQSPDVECCVLSEASRWLGQYFQVTSKPKPSIMVRRLVGIKLFIDLENSLLIPMRSTTIPPAIRNLFFKFFYRFQGVPFQIAEQTIRLDESLRRWNVEAELTAYQILRQWLRMGDVFLDIGANFGLHTLYGAKLVGEAGSVWAFEPVSSNLNLLRRNVRLNGLERQVTIVPKAVSNSSESLLQFYLPPEEIAVTASLRPSSENIQTTQVGNVRLDDYWSQINRPVRLIKIDVEGAELEVLRGAKSLLQQWKPILLIEVHGFALPNFGTSVNELREFLKCLDYEEKLIPGEQFRGEEYFQALYYLPVQGLS